MLIRQAFHAIIIFGKGKMPSKATGKKYAGIGDSAVRARTGKGWSDWFKILDRGSKGLSHTDKVKFLARKFPRLSGWWLQMVTVGYEQGRGMREKYQTARGYEASRSKTVAVPLSAAFNAWKDEKMRRRWLKEPGIIVRKSTPRKSMRISWKDGKTSVEVNFYSKGESKSQVTVQHTKLSTMTEAKRMQSYWSEKLDILKGTLER